MTRAGASRDQQSERHLLLVSRRTGDAALVRSLAGSTEHRRSAVEAVLGAMTNRPRCVTVRLGDLSGRHREFLGALRKIDEGLPVVLLVSASDEGLATALVRDGLATDYGLVPGRRDALRRVFRDPFGQEAAGAESPGLEAKAYLASGGESPGATGDRSRRLFRAACDLAGLADRPPSDLLARGIDILLSAIAAEAACAFRINAAGDLSLTQTIGQRPMDLTENLSLAHRTTRNRESVSLQSGTNGSRKSRLCVPILGTDNAYGAICVDAGPGGRAPTEDDRQDLERLAAALGRLMDAAVARQRERTGQA